MVEGTAGQLLTMIWFEVAPVDDCVGEAEGGGGVEELGEGILGLKLSGAVIREPGKGIL